MYSLNQFYFGMKFSKQYLNCLYFRWIRINQHLNLFGSLFFHKLNHQFLIWYEQEYYFSSQLIYYQLLNFFGQMNQYFHFWSFRSEVCSWSLSKFSNAIESSWRNPLIGFLSLIFESFNANNKIINLVVGLFHDVNVLLNILACLNFCFFYINFQSFLYN